MWANDGIHARSQTTDLLGRILWPEVAAGYTFGGPHKDRLFIIAATPLYTMDLNTPDVPRT